MSRVVRGQRWMSEAEPELGLGTIVQVDERSVVIDFTAVDEVRRYALGSAPLRRVSFSRGDTVTDVSGEQIRVETVDDEGGLLVYRGADRSVAEHELSDHVVTAGPRERLLAGRTDSSALFDLRLETLRRLHAVRSSPVRGFVGPRLELIPHQFYIASEVTSRRAPRVLLADETGLGKTIEACLTLNRLLLSGRAGRVLIIVPDPLVHQWLVELRRRFNLRFAIFDEERCSAVEESDPGTNPFSDEQLVLAGVGLFASHALRTEQAAAAGWDVVVVDEAHHLVWQPDDPSVEYSAVEEIAAGAEGLLLLSATPEQLGEQGHFARLRLLDPSRYGDFRTWMHEADGYREAARIGDELAGEGTLAQADAERLAEILGRTSAEVADALGEPNGRRELLYDLIDRHGPGRVMFRNTRSAVPTLPKRELHMHRLDSLPPDSAAAQSIAAEIRRDCLPNEGETLDVGQDEQASLVDDPRIEWLVETIRSNGGEKLLVICRSAAKARAVKDAVDAKINVSLALFHEELTMVHRDRNAASFAEPEGVRVLVCSEIGSEGRNFQHAGHLVMFDLPVDPDLVEQRIGRLDRIGQRGTVHIHVPFVPSSGLEVLARWHAEGVEAFGRPTLSAIALLERFGERVRRLACGDEVDDDLERLIAETAQAHAELAARVEQGRDRLLEMGSLRKEAADGILAAIEEHDDDPSLEDFFLRLLEHYHVYAEEIGPDAYLLNPDAMRSEEFPTLASGETAVTFDRQTAVMREDMEFISQDHPLLGDAMELLAASESGNACFAVVDFDGSPSLLLDASFVLETVAPARLHVDRFLPPTPVRVIVDQRGKAMGDDLDALLEGKEVADGSDRWIAGNQAVIGKMVAGMSEAAERFAEAVSAEIRDSAASALRSTLESELSRMRSLARVNDHIRPEEIAAVEHELDELAAYVAEARLRPDAVRLIWRGPSLDGVPRLSGAS